MDFPKLQQFHVHGWVIFHSIPFQDRAGTNSPLDFNVVGGWEVAHPIFVSKVEPGSIPNRAGLRVGDQVRPIPIS